MLSNFEKDRLAAKEAESIVLDYLSKNMSGYKFADISESKGLLLRGDILAESGAAQIYIEVKDDKCIANTRNVLIEDSVLYHSSGYNQPYLSTADIYAVVSKAEKKIYFFNYHKLKKLAKYAPSRTIPHEEQTTYCNLVSLSETKRTGALIGAAAY